MNVPISCLIRNSVKYQLNHKIVTNFYRLLFFHELHLDRVYLQKINLKLI